MLWSAACSTNAGDRPRETTRDPASASVDDLPVESPPPADDAGPHDVQRPTIVEAPPARCPSEMVLAGDRVCVDRFEAHLRAVDGAGGSTLHPHNHRPKTGRRYVAVSEPGVWPQAYVSRPEAERACGLAGKRLCSRAEWMLACRGTPPSRCNRSKPHVLTILFPERGWSFSYDEHFNSPAVNELPGFLARTAEHAGCVSEAGAFDMVGNVHEWVSDPVTRAFIERFEREMPRQWQPVHAGNGIFMGGFYSTTNEHGAGCAFTTVAHEPGYHDYSVGFRCCTSPRG